MMHTVFGAAAQLGEGRPGPDALAARDVLLHYFVADPRESDPRKARLAEHAM